MTFPSAAKPIPFWFILVFVAVIWGGQYFVRHLWEPDEARYTYVAREMDQHGSWLVPLRNGEPYAHKPPLMFWLIKAGTFLTGGDYNGVSGRFPTFLAAILSLWVVSRLCLMWFDPETAWRSFFILSTSTLFWLKAGTGQIDMLLLSLEMTALYFLFTNEKSPSMWRIFAAFCFMGLAVLAKGPVGLIVPVGIYIFASIFSGNSHNLKKPFWLWGIPLALAWPAAWLLAAKFSGAPHQYLNELLFAQNVGRLSGQFGGHIKPFYYYLQYLIADFLPWIFFVPVSILILKKDDKTRQKLKLLAGWMLFVIVFFSLITVKRNLYILSVYPAAAMIVAAAWPQFRFQSKKWTRASAYPILFLMGLLAVAGVMVPPLLPLFRDLPVSGTVLLPLGLVMGTGTFFLIRCFRRFGPDQTWFNMFVAAFILSELSVSLIVFPALNPMKTPQALAMEARQYLQPAQDLLLFRTNGEIYALYSKHSGKRIDSVDKLLSEMKQQGKGIVVFSKDDRKIIDENIKTGGEIKEFKMGHKDVCFLKFDLSPEKPLKIKTPQAG